MAESVFAYVGPAKSETGPKVAGRRKNLVKGDNVARAEMFDREASYILMMESGPDSAPHPRCCRRYTKDNESYFLISTFALSLTSQGPWARCDDTYRANQKIAKYFVSLPRDLTKYISFQIYYQKLLFKKKQ